MNKPHGWDSFEKISNGEISEEEFNGFQDLLRTDSELRKNYRRYTSMQSKLQDMAEGQTNEAVAWQNPEVISGQGQSGMKLVNFTGWLAAAAAIIIMLVIQRPGPVEVEVVDSEPAVMEEQQAEGVAVITKLVDVEFKDKVYRNGQAIGNQPFEITSGFVQLEFFCGATVVLEGPANLEPISAWKAVCHTGKLRAHVPPAAQGFTIKVDETDVVDLGTEFAIDVSGGKKSIQVFDGEVQLNSDKLDKHSITAGKAVDLDSEGNALNSQLEESKFIGMNDLYGLQVKKDIDAYKTWMNFSKDINTDPRLIAYYNFTQNDFKRRVLKNSSPKGQGLDGAIVGAAYATGRWGTKSALTFKRPGDRVRINIPGDYKSLTFSCWTKIDSLDRLYNSLYLTDSYQKGEPHWQIMNDGRLMFTTKVRDFNNKVKHLHSHKPSYSPVFWKPEYAGKWLHLGVRLDVEQQVVTHFVNGKVFSVHDIEPDYEVSFTRFGTGEIGNWGLPNKPDKYYAVRNLNGAIDEFAIFSEALSDEEIKNIFDKGNPYQ